ncbi:uncharacterized protein LOC122648214 [Telopea speciosissima]|uniref:uncharacterized protein LOC122648214 n=1 Tax=Telopea speciosissima TaxID=54955 RepID=UPI001CC82D66|nr:uncharacterized protein LOC122648214 [Telopea speciosissima]
MEGLPTKDQLIKRNIQVGQNCSFCWAGIESHEHLFFIYPFSSSIWGKVSSLCSQGGGGPTTIQSAIAWLASSACADDMLDMVPKLAFCATVHYIWWERNRRLFENKVRTHDQIVEAIRLDVSIKCAAFSISVIQNPRNQFLADKWGLRVDWKTITQKTCAWFRPPANMTVLHCDGSLTVDRASYGGIICDATGAAIMAFVGNGDNNSVLSMELYAILRGVSFCVQNSQLQVSIRSDSKLAVDILNGVVSCPWNMQTLRDRISSIFHHLQRKEIKHVWREINQPADFIASMDTGDGEVIIYPPDFPPELVELIKNDYDRKVYFRNL